VRDAVPFYFVALIFAAVAFASIVSLMPGVFLFRTAEGLVGLLTLGEKAILELLLGTIADGAIGRAGAP
jgi:hypothetical protein